MFGLATGRRSCRGTKALSLGLLAAGRLLPALAGSQPTAAHAHVKAVDALRYQTLLACPTTLDHIGRIVIPVRVNGHGPFRFVIDTGANDTTISSQLASTLKLQTSTTARVDLEGITGSRSSPAVRIEKLRAGSLIIHNTYAPVLHTPMMANADGILGIAGLNDLTLLVNFTSNRVQIARNLEPDVRFDYTRVHTQLLSNGLMAVAAYVGNVRALAIIDTGSERTLGNVALQHLLHLRHVVGQPAPITFVYGATKQVAMGKLIPVPPIVVGPLRVLGTSMIFGQFHIFRVWGLRNRPALILGMDVLGTVRALGFDFSNHTLFVAGARSAKATRFHTRAYQTDSGIH